MRSARRFIMLGCLVLGSVWLLQGVGVLPGSFMTGQSFWAWMGAVLLLAGAGMAYREFRR